ncbi:acyl-CoA dehydrogenase [Afipia sp. P52-10]|uniref:acyl-CoA dehydrogenase family protein n=1 Tax=Afipia sp. P52-10 TaxID=1429916 RepID=UPI0003DEFF43|nr:acyl-CoA dehydrogenase family protein [Afipia sp. P52-10]ETR78060.1 acyl-CoA dehydrogenase [Afipia sp. P52-10]
MDLSFSKEELAFRDEVREFIAKNLTEDVKRMQRLTPSALSEKPVFASWHAALSKKGWVSPYWPKQHGGTGWTPAQRYIFETECGKAGTPSLLPFGVHMVGPVIIKFGSEQQKAFYLPRIVSGEDYWCQGYSEPGSGSDLASLKTRAVRDGDHYVVNGTKIWTTHAHFANRMFALVRTADTPKRQEGISFLLIDMTTKGISTRPIITIGGDHEVNQVFFDDVRVPVENRIGEENKGWTYAKYLLEFERGASFRAARFRRQLGELKRLNAKTGNGAGGDASIATRIAEAEIDVDALEMIELKLLSDVQAGRNPGPVSSVLKLRGTEIFQTLTRIGVDIIGTNALVWEPRRPLYSLNEAAVLPDDELAVLPAHLDGRAHTIFGGTSEIQHEIVAKQMLGL